jgi:hypothetical protein
MAPATAHAKTKSSRRFCRPLALDFAKLMTNEASCELQSGCLEEFSGIKDAAGMAIDTEAIRNDCPFVALTLK